MFTSTNTNYQCNYTINKYLIVCHVNNCSTCYSINNSIAYDDDAVYPRTLWIDFVRKHIKWIGYWRWQSNCCIASNFGTIRSTISSLGLDRLTFYGPGNDSLYGATLYCYGNSSCNVYIVEQVQAVMKKFIIVVTVPYAV